MLQPAPLPKNEIGRITALADMNLEYSNLTDTLKDLVKLAAKVSGSPISMVNIIDNYTVWTVSAYGLETSQTPREESVCQYTINGKEDYVVNDLSVSPIFKDADFVTGGLKFRFYYGIPLAAQEHNIGALCVLDDKAKSLSAEKIELLRIIADEVTNRLKILSHVETLRDRVQEVKNTQNKVVHDIRGPIAGIMGLAEIIKMQGKENDLDQVLEFIGLIHKGGKSILDLADDILSEEKGSTRVRPHEMLLATFRKRLEELYTPQALSKNIELKVVISDVKEDIPFPHKKLMQIAGNLISNAIKFTPKFGNVTVNLGLQKGDTENTLKITVADTGDGITSDQIATLLADNTESTDGTDGEKGYGFGLALVKHLVRGLNGTFGITSEMGKGSQFDVVIPFKVG